jgi:short-subunit dehydrogenase
MDILHMIGDLWLRRHADPKTAALAKVGGLSAATVITGASEGLGLALAKRLAREGRTVVLLARSVDLLEKAAENLSEEFPRAKVIEEAFDVRDVEAPRHLDEILDRHGLYLDVLVNNAAIGIGGEFSSLDQEMLDELVATNVAALTRLTRHYLPQMRARARGGILNLASLASFVPGPWQAPYFASKAYVLSLTAAIGKECAGEGVRICALAPGPIETGIHRKMRTTNTYYRLVLPSISADRMARIAWRAYRLGRRVVVVGFVANLFAWSARAMPFELILPLVSWLMRPRQRPIPGMATRMRAQVRIDRAPSIRDLESPDEQALEPHTRFDRKT